jgi:hypothetical protein
VIRADVSAARVSVVVRTLVVILVVAMSLATIELIARRIDGYSLFAWHLVRERALQTPSDAVTASYVGRTPTAAGVDRSWFSVDPSQATGGSRTADPDLARRAAAHPGFQLQSVYEWNLQFLRDAACSTDAARYDNVQTTALPIGDLYVFEPLGRAPYPRYRYLRNAHYPSELVTNSFGWRGLDVALTKPANTIRIAFVGASTTAAPHLFKYSYPDYVGAWLEAWRAAKRWPYRFEVINAGREGINSTSIAAIVRDELVPVDPDLVVYYEGANQFFPIDYIQWPGGAVPPRPRRSGPWHFESSSALIRRLHSVRDPFGVRSSEPRKPSLAVRWPPDLDEHDPALDHPRLSLELPTIMRDLDVMQSALVANGGRLFVSSFVWCVKDGMQLDPGRDAAVYAQLNEMYWPYSYAYMRRMADFQNRVLAKYARSRGLAFIDVAARYPIDPRLFVDAIHMTPNGTKLMAWITFQNLVAVLERSIVSGALPRPARHHLASHPAFSGSPRELMSVASIRAQCHG